jgi:tetratricopeptide (TPR) repeat protein
VTTTTQRRWPMRARWGRYRLRLAAGHATYGLPTDALRHAESAIRHLRVVGSPPDVASAYHLAAAAHHDLGDLPAAVAARRAAVALFDVGDGGSVDHALALVALGDLLRFCAQFAEAEQILDLALQTCDHEQPDTGPSVRAAALSSLGILYKDTGRYHAASAAYREALTLITTRSGSDNEAAAPLWHNIAGLAHVRGQATDAAAAASRAVEIRQRAVGPSHRLVALDLAVYGAALLDLDRLDEAEAVFRRALDIFQARAPADRYEVAVNLSNLAACRVRRDDPAGAEALFQRALTIKRSILGDHHPEIARQLNNLAVAVAQQARTTEAQALQRHAVDIASRSLPPHHPLIAACRQNVDDAATKPPASGAAPQPPVRFREREMTASGGPSNDEQSARSARTPDREDRHFERLLFACAATDRGPLSVTARD